MIVNNLKSLFLVGIALTTLITEIMAQKEKKYKVIETTLTSNIINVSADSLWAILREFDITAEWTSTLDHSEGAGEAQFEGTTCNERVCTANKSKLVEKLIMFKDGQKELAYELTEGAPSFVKYAKNHWKVYEISSNQSVVEMDVTMHISKFMNFFLGRAITKQMTKTVGIVQSELKIYAETGEVSEAKKEQIAKDKY